MAQQGTTPIIVLMLLPLWSSFAANFEAGVKANAAGDYARAVKELSPLAKKGDIRAQVNLAYLYFNGQGVSQSYKEAAEWLRKAIRLGHADIYTNYACVGLGRIYQYGYGVPQDREEAARWYQTAAARGDSTAQAALAELRQPTPPGVQAAPSGPGLVADSFSWEEGCPIGWRARPNGREYTFVLRNQLMVPVYNIRTAVTFYPQGTDDAIDTSFVLFEGPLLPGMTKLLHGAVDESLKDRAACIPAREFENQQAAQASGKKGKKDTSLSSLFGLRKELITTLTRVSLTVVTFDNSTTAKR